ncbi:hypothetical protein BDV38DRAFT_244206 [Aspergillus pseudotamarii]|uniref:Uncharacterized protein n=1 Tax=Aspergillus pseudotamarii TaxID=132259 RepID=A0A5N6SXL1_ASPPS|nr:uncharacterized protein BDV38DRAFT_244206 [Aspergillus pseudotamarii]KAE8138647.1 hypothetical protein BDV38DRAFT_244206 [Aspergillus pseudotamarii]
MYGRFADDLPVVIPVFFFCNGFVLEVVLMLQLKPILKPILKPPLKYHVLGRLY